MCMCGGWVGRCETVCTCTLSRRNYLEWLAKQKINSTNRNKKYMYIDLFTHSRGRRCLLYIQAGTVYRGQIALFNPKLLCFIFFTYKHDCGSKSCLYRGGNRLTTHH